MKNYCRIASKTNNLDRFIVPVLAILFALISMAQSPGGVTGAAVWLKADAGTGTTTGGNAVVTWTDQSASAFSFTADHRNATDNPSFVSAGINFNPAVYYDGGAMHTIPTGTGPLLVNSTVFFAGKLKAESHGAGDSYNAMWVSTDGTVLSIIKYLYL